MMKPRHLLAVPCCMLINAAIVTLGPYSRVNALLDGRAPFEESPASSPHEAREVLSSIGAAGRALYMQYQAWDVLFILSTAIPLYVLLRFASERLFGRPAGIIALAATVPAVLDLAENIALWRLLASGGESRFWWQLSSAATPTKLVAFAAIALVIVVVWLGLGIRAIGRRTLPDATAATAAA
ncbi:MAG: hypothetical protein ABL309_03560 [Phycisphaerales bacterium]